MSEFFGFSEAAMIGFHSMVLLARNPGTEMSLHELAQQLSASEAHLAKVLQRLRKTGLINATRGPSGGYRLARPADTTALSTVYEAIEGPVESRITQHSTCPLSTCRLKQLMNSLSLQVIDYLRRTTLENLATETTPAEGVLS